MIERFNIADARREFPVTQRMLYFDSAHQTPLAGSVRKALESFYTEGHEYAGPKCVWLRRVEEIRARVAKLMGAEPSEIAFTKNTSEGLNIAANAIPFKAGDNVLMVEGDHPNNAYAFLNLQKKGVEVRFVPISGETVTAESLAPFIDNRTLAISLSHVTFHAGHRFDIAGIGRLATQKGIYLVVDAMQSAGVLPINAKESGASFIAFGCHKGLYVPQGLGILFVRKDLALEPVYMAAASLAEPPADFIARADNMKLRAGAGRFEIGNFNIPDIHALAAALDLIETMGVEAIAEHVLDLGDYLIAQLDELGVSLVGPRSRDHRAHIYVLDLKGEGWVEYFANENIRISPERDGIRVSFGFFNTTKEIDRLVDVIRRRGSKEKADAKASQLVD